jgi:hypothetical protein
MFLFNATFTRNTKLMRREWLDYVARLIGNICSEFRKEKAKRGDKFEKL